MGQFAPKQFVHKAMNREVFLHRLAHQLGELLAGMHVSDQAN